MIFMLEWVDILSVGVTNEPNPCRTSRYVF